MLAEARRGGLALLTRERGFAPAPGVVALVDDAVPEAAPPEDVPDAARARGGPLHRCPACGRVFWPGSHVRRMRARLEGWAAAGRGG